MVRNLILTQVAIAIHRFKSNNWYSYLHKNQVGGLFGLWAITKKVMG